MARHVVKELVRPAAMRGSRWWGQFTSDRRMLPSFLIVGAQRCGTTSMYRALVQHPAILRPALRKGIHFFDTGYRQGLDRYRGNFPLETSARRVAARTGVPTQTFESSPYYMFHPAAAERIAADLPDVKLLVLLRDPVERAYSAHAHEYARGFDPEPFERAIELEPERLAGEEERLRSDPAAYSHAHQHQAYVTRGHYIDQLERLAKSVDRDRIHVVDSQDFFDDPGSVYPGVLEFLGLPRHVPVFDQHNARPRSPMDDAVRDRLAAQYAESDTRLETWWGQTPSWRR